MVVLDATLYLRKASFLPCPVQILVDGGEFGGLVPGLALSLPPVPLLISSAPNLFCFFYRKAPFFAFLKKFSSSECVL